jgi:hypothetical protein
MSRYVWQATRELAAVWRSSTYVQDYLAGAAGPLRLCADSGHHILAQPFYMWKYLPTHLRYDHFARTAGADAWLDKCRHLDHAYTTMVEWLRSRLGGYPFLGAPQLTRTSPWTTVNVSMQVPWLIELRRWQLQMKATPPTIPFLEIDSTTQLSAGDHLGAAITSSPAAVEIAAAWHSLADSDKEQLRTACAAVRQTPYPAPDDVTGSEDFRELSWAETTLDDAIRPLTGPARAFTDALTTADRLIQQTAALFSQLVVYNQVRQLPNVTLVEQFDGADGWHTVRSDTFVFEQIRQFEILGFDHPYPRGVMMVAGTKQEMPFGPHHGAVTVYGRILADSDQLADLAVPIQVLDTAPQPPAASWQGSPTP